MTVRLLSPISQFLPASILSMSFLQREGGGSVLDSVYLSGANFARTSDGVHLSARLLIDGEAVIPVPLLPDLAVVIAAASDPAADVDDAGLTELDLSIWIGNKTDIALRDVPIGLRLPSSLFRPLDGSPAATITTRGTFHVDSDFNVKFEGFDSASLSRCELAGSGVIVSADELQVDSGTNELTFASLTVELPEGLPAPDLQMRQARIGSTGFSGSVHATWQLDFDATSGLLTGQAVANLFGADDAQVGLEQAVIVFEESRPVQLEVKGKLILPLFSPSPVNVVFSIGARGELRAALTDLGIELNREGLLKLRIESLEVLRSAEEVAVTLGGQLTITAGDLLPPVQVDALSVRKLSNGPWSFNLRGGALRINRSIDVFGAARADVETIALGQDNDGFNTFAITAGVHLLDIDASVWVNNLRIPWKIVDGHLEVKRLAIDGLGLRVVIPNTLEFTGAAVRKEEEGLSYFEGLIDLTVIPVELGIGASFRVGRGDCRFAYLAARVQFPGAGIQLGCLPLYLRAVNGVVGISMTPDANEVREYYGLVTRAPVGLEHVAKWRIECDHNAIGFGADIATANPKLLNLSAMLAYLDPEARLVIVGKAFVLQEPAPGKDPPLTAVMVLDMKQPAAMLNIGAKYEFVKGVMAADGELETYFGPDPKKPKRQTSYFALGQVKPYFPVDRPINATVLKIFKARSYFIVKPGIWALGASIGLPKKKISFSAASVKFEAYMKGAGELFWGPVQFKGYLKLKGGVAFRILGKGFDLDLSARVLGMAPDWLVDALLKFGIRFKIACKKIEFGGKIPFRWKRRRRPRIGPVLSEIRLQHAVTADTIDIFLTDPTSDPEPVNVPDVTPDVVPVLAFRFPTNDLTGFPFGQGVSDHPLRHKSGDYVFEANLPGGADSERGIRFRRMLLEDFENGGSWDDQSSDYAAEDFETSLTTPATPVLYGAWQADQAPDGTQGATHLHLFARTPFEYSRATRLNTLRTQQVLDLYHTLNLDESSTTVAYASPESSSAISAIALTALSDDITAPLVQIPETTAAVKPFSELEQGPGSLPLRGVQIAVHDSPGYPWINNEEAKTYCRNFMRSRPGFRAYDDPIGLGHLTGMSTNPEKARTDVLIGAVGFFTVGQSSAIRGIAEVVRDQTGPYPISHVELHTDRGFDSISKRVEAGSLPTYGAFLRISVRRPVNRLIVNYAGTKTYPMTSGSVELPSLRIAAAYNRTFDAAFWSGTSVSPAPFSEGRVKEGSRGGVLIISKSPEGRSFTDVLFYVLAPTRVFSICFEYDQGVSAANDPNHPLRGFMDICWGYRPSGETPEEPGGDVPEDEEVPHSNIDVVGPISVDGPNMTTPDGAIRPGYVYRLDVKTTHSRNEGAPRNDEYTGYFKVTQPPTDLAPYVSTAFPIETGFPHYRAHELYIRFNRNYVHAICGKDVTEHAKIKWRLIKDGQTVVELPFRDGQDADLTAYAQNTSAARKGWGWGKAPDHVLSREESCWLEAYNASAPDESLKISADMAIPDDIAWIYPVNPVLFRASFGAFADAAGAGSQFLSPISRTGGVVSGRWRLEAGFLNHHQGATDISASTDSLVLSASASSPIALNAPYVVSAWIRPWTVLGSVGLVVGAAADGSRFLAVEFDVAASRVRVIRYDATKSTTEFMSNAKPISLSSSRWTKIVAKVTLDSTTIAITVDADGEMVLSDTTDVSAAEIGSCVGFMADAEYSGWFDNLEVVSGSRLVEIPSPSTMHQLACYYGPGDTFRHKYVSLGPGRGANIVIQETPDPIEIYRRSFLTSRYLDLFDHLNDWDRAVRLTGGAPVSAYEGTFAEVHSWGDVNARHLTALWEVATAEAMRANNGASLQDVEEARKRLVEARLNLDDAFSAVAAAAGAQLPVRPDRMSVTVTPDGRGLLIVSPEPVDWTRLSPGAIRAASATAGPYTVDMSEEPAVIRSTVIVYNSDFTQAFLLRTDDLTDPAALFYPFVSGLTYIWDLREYISLPPHLSWLQGWVTHRAKTYTLAFQIP